MVPIKFCGMRREEDICMINEVKPDYIGFIFAPSKRQVTPSQAKILIEQTTVSLCVGVFVNEKKEMIRDIACYCQLDVIQLHGNETDEDIQWLKQHTPCAIWKALRLRGASDHVYLRTLHPDRFLLDSFHENMAGGSGKCIDQQLLKGLDISNVFLAGGIQINNIQEILTLKPYGIDVSSGIETNEFKDYNKMKELIEEVRMI